MLSREKKTTLRKVKKFGSKKTSGKTKENKKSSLYIHKKSKDFQFLGLGSSDQLASFPQMNPMPVLEIGPSGKVLYMNPAAKKVLPDLLSSGLEHPYLKGVLSVTTKLKASKKEWIQREVQVAGAWYTQMVTAVDGGSRIRIYAVDITKRKKAEEELRHVKEEWEQTFDTVPDLLAILDEKHRMVRVNRAMADRLGFPLDKCIGLRCYEAVHGLLQPPAFCPHVLSCRDGKEHIAEVYEPRLGGHFLVSTTPRFDQQGKFIGSVHVARDITERKKAEEAVQVSLDRYRSYIEATGQLGWTTNAEGEVVEDIPSWRNYTGQSYEEIKGWGWSKALHPDDLEQTTQAWRKAVAAKTSYEVEYRIRRQDGVYRLFLARGLPVLEEDGSVREWVGTCIDITERKKIEEALRDSEELLNRAQEIAHLGSWELDLLNNRLSWSDEVYRIFGLKPQEFGATYEAFLEAVHPDDRKAVDAAYSGSLSEGRDSYEIEHRVVRKATGEARIVHEKCEHIRDEHGRIVRSVGMVHDITERKKVEEEIRALNEHLKRHEAELTAANKELEAFSYSVSHDLRAPLRNIDGFSQALLEDYTDKLDQKGKDYLKRVRAATQRMGGLIDDLLNLSMMIRKEMRREEVDLSNQASKIMAELKNTAPERKVEVKIREKMRVSGDPLLLHQLLENLLGNAWKFTSKHPYARIEFGSTQKDGKKTFFIKDNGVGFDMKYVNKMFIPFQRLHSVEEFSGNGIGLAIVKRVIDRHGGMVWAEGEVGKGATFYFTFE